MCRAATIVTVLLVISVLQNIEQIQSEDCLRQDYLDGRKCEKYCEKNVECKSKKKSCECDGVCGRSCVNQNLRCLPEPSAIPHGSVSILPYNRFGAIARYTCQEGYSLVGLPARVCQGDETWNGNEPKCIMNRHLMADKGQECSSPPVVNHAQHHGTRPQKKFVLGTNIRYRCKSGYVPRKDSVDRAWCVGGGIWVGPNMTCISVMSVAGCEPPSSIADGSVVVFDNFGEGARAEYRCNPGYFLIGNRIRQCSQTGEWKEGLPKCVKVVCGPAPHVDHADHDADADVYRFATGTTLNYACHFGYYREGSPRAICSGPNGNWVGPSMACKARDCGAPGEVNNGWREPGYRFTYPTRLTYHCNEGYELIGRGYRECQANGQWSGVLPSCQPVHCLELRPPLHGTMIGSGTTFASLIRFVCNDGFKVVGSSKRTCQPDRTWSGLDASCEEINCGMPDSIWNGYLDGHRTTVGAVYFYRCNVRNKFHGESFSTQCLDSGQWSYPPPLCLGQCQVPKILNGTIDGLTVGVWVDTATVVSLRCLNGLVMNETNQPICNNGSWTVIPRCVPAPCVQLPPVVNNGHRVFFGVGHGDRARYFCIEGYRLTTPNQYMSCRYGRWTGHKPKCVINYCKNPGNIKNGKVYKKGSVGKFLFREFIYTIKHGTRLEYVCDRNYNLVGPQGAACVNGQWSPIEKPQCVRSRHPIFVKLWKPYEERQPDIYAYHR